MDDARTLIAKKLLETLDELTKLYRQVLETIRVEKDILLAADLERLQKHNESKELLLQKLRLGDALREARARELATAIGLDTSTPRLLDLAQKLGGPEADRMRSLHGALDLLIRRVSELNRENATYANSALKTLSGAMNEIKDTLAGKKVYERKGTYKRGPEVSGNFVSKEA